MSELWYLGTLNDGVFIINTPPRPSTDEVWHDRPDGPSVVIPISALTDVQAKAIVDEHNLAITTLISQRDKLVKALEDLLAAIDGARSGYIDFSEPALQWEARYKQVRHEVETTLSQTKEGV